MSARPGRFVTGSERGDCGATTPCDPSGSDVEPSLLRPHGRVAQSADAPASKAGKCGCFIAAHSVTFCRLHAAAPDLAAALQYVLDSIGDEGAWRGAVEHARAALAKVRP